MLHSNGQNACPDRKPASTTVGTRHVPEYSPAQVELMQLIMMHGPDELSRSLRRIHDMALYFSDIPLDDDEKSALYDVKLLSDFIDQVVENT